MPLVKNPSMPMAPSTAPVPAAAPTPVMDRAQQRAASSYDSEANMVRTATGIAGPGKAASVNTPKPGQMSNPLEMQKIAADNAKNQAKQEKRAIVKGANSRPGAGISAGPSVFGPSYGTAGNPADNPPDFSFFPFRTR